MKIQELVDQAGWWQPSWLPSDWDKGDYVVSPDGMRRFAELIINECARTASHFSIENKRIHPDIDPKDMPDANQMVYHCTCQSVAWEIKEHFGLNDDEQTI